MNKRTANTAHTRLDSHEKLCRIMQKQTQALLHLIDL
jgi:hypothetical protein